MDGSTFIVSRREESKPGWNADIFSALPALTFLKSVHTHTHPHPPLPSWVLVRPGMSPAVFLKKTLPTFGQEQTSPKTVDW